MWLSITQAKIDAALEDTTPTYVVVPCNMEWPQITEIPAPSAQVSGTVAFPTDDLESYRNRVLSLRKNVIERGNATSSEELEAVIASIRGR